MEFFQVLFAIFGAIFVFVLVVTIHEFGHYFVARWVGVKVFTFSIGFGKPLFSKTLKNGVRFVVGLFPLGGYVRMWSSKEEVICSETPGSIGTCFLDKSVWAKAAIIIAGPFFNFLLAIVVFTFFYLHGQRVLRPIIGSVAPHSIAAKAGVVPGDEFLAVGQWETQGWQDVLVAFSSYLSEKKLVPVVFKARATKKPVVKQFNLTKWQYRGIGSDLLTTLGVAPYLPPIPAVVASVVPDSSAFKGGVKPGDLIVDFNARSVTGWEELVKLVEQHPNQTVKITVKRAGAKVQLNIKLGEITFDHRRRGFLGVSPKAPDIPADLMRVQHYTFFPSLGMAFKKVWDLVYLQAVFLKKLLIGHLSVKTLGGPAMVFYSAGSATLSGLSSFLSFIGLLNVILAFINLLPIPGLDGGQLLFCFIEGVMGKPLSPVTQNFWTICGISCLLLLICIATLNDISRFL